MLEEAEPAAHSPVPPPPRRPWVSWDSRSSASPSWQRPSWFSRFAPPADPPLATFVLPCPKAHARRVARPLPIRYRRPMAVLSRTMRFERRRESPLWFRALGSLHSRRLDHTEGAQFPFWSPDSQSVAFSWRTSLKKVALGGGSPQQICPLAHAETEVASAMAGRGIAMASSCSQRRGGPLLRVSAGGGTPLRSPLWLEPARPHISPSSSRMASTSSISR